MMIMKKIYSLYLLFIFISFIGFLYETLLAYLFQFSDLDRGFLSLPLCPIYGSGVIITYLIFNLPRDMKIFNYTLKSKRKLKLYLYFLFSAILATLLEWIVGVFFEKYFNIVLWEYSSLMLNFNKYCSLLPSILWGLAITTFMNTLFEKLYNKINNIKYENMIVITYSTLLLIIIDIMTLIFK